MVREEHQHTTQSWGLTPWFQSAFHKTPLNENKFKTTNCIFKDSTQPETTQNLKQWILMCVKS